MKTLSLLLENYESNPGNGIKCGVTNHLTPIGNIITNVRNIFGPVCNIVVEPGEDGVSLKLHSTKFVSVEGVNNVLNKKCFGNTTLVDYIKNQGLNCIKLINLGAYYVVYAGPDDVVTTEPCSEIVELGLDECELDVLCPYNVSENFDDKELEDTTKEKLLEFINGVDKVKCAVKLAELLSSDLELPGDYYFKGVKDSDGNESIALRYKFMHRRPFGKEVELVKSLLNIYKSGKEAVWVEAFLNRETNSEEMNNIIEKVLKLIGAEPTNDPCVYTITDDTIQDLKNDITDKVEDSVEKVEEPNDEDADISNTLKDSNI